MNRKHTARAIANALDYLDTPLTIPVLIALAIVSVLIPVLESLRP